MKSLRDMKCRGKVNMRVLFVSYMPPCFSESYPLISYMRETGLFEPVVYFNHSREYGSHQVDVCLSDDVIALYESGQRVVFEEREKQISNKKKAQVFDGLIQSFRKSFCAVMRRLSFLAEFFYLLKRRKIINKILRQYSIRGVVLGLDMAGRDSGLIVKECHNRGIPVITLTWVFASGDDPANALCNKEVYPEYQATSFFNELLVKSFPKYLYTYRGVEIVRFPALKAIWHELLKIGAPLPWVFNSGKSDSIIVDSVAMYHFYEKAGIPSGQLKLTGMPIQDCMAKVLMNKDVNRYKLCEVYGFDCRKPMLFTGLPPDCFSILTGAGEPICEFASYEELTKFWMDSLKQLSDKFNIIVTVHPETSQPERNRLEQLYGIKIINVTMSTAEVIPLCDLYITSVSSTMRWAIACGIPVVDYDVYDFDNQLGPVPGVACVKNKEDFLATLDMILVNDDYLSKMRKRQGNVSGDFGKLDGMACKRISELLENHIETYNKKIEWRSHSQMD